MANMLQQSIRYNQHPLYGFNHKGEVVGFDQKEHKQIYPKPLGRA